MWPQMTEKIGAPGPTRTGGLRIRSPLPQSFQIVSRSVSAPVAPSDYLGSFLGQLKRLFNLAKVARKWQVLLPRKWGMTLGAVGLCPYCRRRIYTPFIDHFDRCQEFARALVSGERQ